jgi:hypothetical protein
VRPSFFSLLSQEHKKVAIWESFLAKMARYGLTGEQALSALTEQGFDVDAHRFWSTWRLTLSQEEAKAKINEEGYPGIPPIGWYINKGWHLERDYEDVFRLTVYNSETDEIETNYVTIAHDERMALMDLRDMAIEIGTAERYGAKLELIGITWEAGYTRL